jgi:hypothetical protein
VQIFTLGGLLVERFRAKHALGLDPWADTGSREENASKTSQSPVPFPSERKEFLARAAAAYLIQRQYR